MKKCVICDTTLKGEICPNCGMNHSKSTSKPLVDSHKFRDYGQVSNKNYDNNADYTDTSKEYEFNSSKQEYIFDNKEDGNNNSSNENKTSASFKQLGQEQWKNNSNWQKNAPKTTNKKGCGCLLFIAAFLLFNFLIPIISMFTSITMPFSFFGSTPEPMPEIYSDFALSEVEVEVSNGDVEYVDDVEDYYGDEYVIGYDDDFFESGSDITMPEYEDFILYETDEYYRYLNQGVYIIGVDLPSGVYSGEYYDDAFYSLTVNNAEVMIEDFYEFPLYEGDVLVITGDESFELYAHSHTPPTLTVVNEDIYDYRYYIQGEIAGIDYPVGTYDIWHMNGSSGMVHIIYPEDFAMESFSFKLSDENYSQWYFDNVPLPFGTEILHDEGMVLTIDNSLFEYLS